MKNKVQIITFWGAWIFVFCYFAQMFNFPNVLTVVGGIALCALFALQQKAIRIDFGAVMLTITMMSYYVIVNGKRGLFFVILYIPIVMYALANYMVHAFEKDETTDSKFKYLIYALVIGFTIHGLLNIYMYFAGYREPGETKWLDFWGRFMVPGTQHAVYYLPALAMLLPAVVFFKKDKVFYIVMMLSSALFCYTALIARSRMALIIVILVFAIEAIIYLIFEWEKVKSLCMNRKVQVMAVIVIAFAVVAGIVFIRSSLFQAFQSVLSKDGGIINNIRFQAQREALGQLFDYPMGGRKMDTILSYCHNVWLDMAKAAGLIPLTAFLLYTVFTIYELLKLLLKRDIDIQLKLMVFGVYSVFFLFFHVEPALDASVHFLVPWFFMNGLIHGSLSCGKVELKNQNE